MIQEIGRGWRRGISQREILIQLSHSRTLTETREQGEVLFLLQCCQEQSPVLEDGAQFQSSSCVVPCPGWGVALTCVPWMQLQCALCEQAGGQSVTSVSMQNWVPRGWDIESLCQDCAYPEGSGNTERPQGNHPVISAIGGRAEEVIQRVKTSRGVCIKKSSPSQGHMCKGTMGTAKTIYPVTNCF